MSDTRHLKRRDRKSGPRWYVQLAVPRDVQEKLGIKRIERNLHTSNLVEAQRRRWKALAEIEQVFERARGQRGLTSIEIEAEAQRYMRETLAAIRRKPGLFEPVPGDSDNGLICEGVLWDMEDQLSEEDYSDISDHAKRIARGPKSLSYLHNLPN